MFRQWPEMGRVIHRKDYSGLGLQRAKAAFFAIAERLDEVSLAALALPPLSPPSLPSETAAGFFSIGLSG
jgi:hypothetical protein